MRFFANADYQFISMRRGAYVVSGIVVGLGLLAILVNTIVTGSWLNYGVDFTGGSLVQVHFTEAVAVDDLRGALGGPSAPEITRFGEETEFVIRAPLVEGADIDQAVDNVTGRLEEAFGEGSFRVVRTELVGPKIGAELQQKAALAILFSFVLTLIYLAIRFEFRFGLAAIIATVHDILIALGFLSAAQIEIMLPTVAAILTIIGYSLNDTIVVFDRVRENLKKAGRKPDQEALVNRSINEVLPRTILTSGTTLVVLLSLLFLGGAVIRDFAIVLILGVVIGTYSSIFVASPALLEIQRRWAARTAGRERRSAATA